MKTLDCSSVARMENLSLLCTTMSIGYFFTFGCYRITNLYQLINLTLKYNQYPCRSKDGLLADTRLCEKTSEQNKELLIEL